MELITRSPLQNQMVEEKEVVSSKNRNFIEANTKKVSLEHLKNDCIIPVFAKDNESTISHYEFVQKTREIAQDLFPEFSVSEPDIRTSHIIKGRIPSAIGKPAKELKEHEKTLYYERLAFVLEIPEVVENVNGNKLALTIGGVRAYNQENLFSKKSPEKFKVFIGFKNMVCTNLCISTDGLADQIRVNSLNQLSEAVENLLNQYDRMKHLGMMERMSRYELTQAQFAHFIGKLRMYQFMGKTEQKQYFPVSLNDSQINTVVKNYYHDPNFSRKEDGSINMWRIFNLLTEANKSSYIDNNLERNVNAYDLTNDLVNSLQNRIGNFFLHN
ncbi:DUF3871 family protein [Salegentibacter salarius]|uniref:DUF3871 family protein n=1 Tax=Salegentibacter salarius TaxID=435906 RepID=A0A2N0TRF6_9FLAO|nr:DUF3871 family protein [Salegentibacter salarius]OEY71971.1 hypothetical protein BHS39_14655 [Salegentibacter salarius]PKD17327.1 hypothetical protein APR40_14625 [Salegentibacter salarius]SLK05542.1 protein of unknown function [Salegentibacter salarius]